MSNSVTKFKYCFLLILSKFIYSLTGIFSKMASREVFLSKMFFAYYAIVIFILGLYAIIWQQALKKAPLSIAMLFKPLALVLSIMWGVLLFNEIMSLKLVVGITIIIIGIIIAGTEYE